MILSGKPIYTPILVISVGWETDAGMDSVTLIVAGSYVVLIGLCEFIRSSGSYSVADLWLQ
jgi:hypothetical protein